MAGEIKIPGAIWAPFKGKSTTPLKYNIACIHTQVGFNQVSYNIGAQAGHSYAHTYLDGDGSELQGQDLRYRAAANLEGNPYVAAWECADHGKWWPKWTEVCGNVPDFTEAQVQTLIRDLAWFCIRFNVPPVLIPDTKPGRRGLAYHAQGISPHLVPGADVWSSSPGKCCPDKRRINTFVNRIIPAVRAIVLAPPPIQGDWLEMATKQEVADLLKLYTSSWLVRPKMPDGTISSHVYIVFSDFSGKFWIGDWDEIKVLDFIENFNDAGTEGGHPKPHNFDWALIGQIPESKNPILGTTEDPIPGGVEALMKM